MLCHPPAESNRSVACHRRAMSEWACEWLCHPPAESSRSRSAGSSEWRGPFVIAVPQMYLQSTGNHEAITRQ